ncbi:MAG TPA: prolyl oligopeptidase family serine peptidase, partial [Tepidiformaceae bacterium]|nr:prolyl oligopeptidase family serine peptidase [Tepidiformaceae bacterium]
PANPDGLRHYGATEWPEVEGAVQFALANGAKHIVLAGYSMGGSTIMAFMERSALAPAIGGLVLDAPVLDFGSTVDFQADQRHAPSVLTKVGKWIASWRFDVEWGNLDYLEHADDLKVPVLLFHGTDDDETPIAESEELAELRPDLVTFIPIAGAEHVRSWNADPAGYGFAVRSFFERLPWMAEGSSTRPAP